jgi:hypothetical protein
MFDPQVEPPLPLQDVPKLPWLRGVVAGRKLAFSTLFRWCTRGLYGVKLEAVRVGGVLCTSEPALGRFFSALPLDGRARTNATTPGAPKPKLDQRRNDRELDRAGIS